MDNAPVFPAARTWKPLLDLALAEDIGLGDVTTALVVPPSQVGTAVLEAREPLVLCGMEVACAVFREVDPALSLDRRSQDGERAAAGAALLGVSGPLSGILMAERTALNFLARMSGVATHTRRFVDAVAGTEARIYDTRKTLPGWRALDKYATAVGGATNHRAGLFDGILLKDNHIAAAGGTELAVKAALSRASAGLRVQVEVECYRDAEIAIGAGADFLLLDNIPIEEMHRIVSDFGERAILEASGGVTLENVRCVAETGVHRISIGALTHSANAVDVALELSEGRNATGGAAA